MGANSTIPPRLWEHWYPDEYVGMRSGKDFEREAREVALRHTISAAVVLALLYVGAYLLFGPA